MTPSAEGSLPCRPAPSSKSAKSSKSKGKGKGKGKGGKWQGGKGKGGKGKGNNFWKYYAGHHRDLESEENEDLHEEDRILESGENEDVHEQEEERNTKDRNLPGFYHYPGYMDLPICPETEPPIYFISKGKGLAPSYIAKGNIPPSYFAPVAKGVSKGKGFLDIGNPEETYKYYGKKGWRN